MTFAETLAGRFQRHVVRDPDRLAFTWLADGDDRELPITRGGLHRRAAALAVHLQDRDVRQARVLLLHDSGLEFIVSLLGCLYSGAVPVPCPASRRPRGVQRLAAIIRDARPRLILADTSVLTALRRNTDVLALLDDLSIEGVAIDTLDEQVDDRWRPPRVEASDLALLQYTSGSTQAPRGVMITQGNLLDNEERIRRAFAQDEQSVIASWLPLHHDMGLIGTVLQPIYTGARAVLMPPARFTEQPLRWLRAIHRHGATTSGGPNFAYDLCVRRVDEEALASLDLRGWRVAFNGAEPIDSRTLARFVQRFAPCGFRAEAFAPCYGLAEVTLFAAGGVAPAGPTVEAFSRSALADAARAALPSMPHDSRALVACGDSGDSIRIVDPETGTPRSDGEVGEIWIDSPSAGAGYWNAPAHTADTFAACLPGSDRRHLRTGDLGFTHGGRLFITGRLKDVIIVRGRNHDPQDLEASIAHGLGATHHGAIAAVPLRIDDREVLGIIAETTHTSAGDHDALIARIRDIVAFDHDIAAEIVALVAAGTLPRTTSGKLQRQRCRASFDADRLRVLAQWRADEPERLAERETPPQETPPPVLETHAAVETSDTNERSGMRDALRTLDALVERILGARPVAREAPLVRWGLDSLKAAWLGHEIERRWAVRIDALELLDGMSLEELGERLRDAGWPRQRVSDRLPHADAAPLTDDKSPLPSDSATAATALSIGQQALWFRQRVAPEDSSSNLAVAARIHGPLDVKRLSRAFARIVAAHPMLTIRFIEERGTPRQAPSARTLAIERRHFPDAAALHDALTAEANRPFALLHEPPIRVLLIDAPGQLPHVLLVVHHIAIDLWSCGILFSDLARAYATHDEGKDLADRQATAARYLEFAQHQRHRFTVEPVDGDSRRDVERLWTYWRHVLREAPAPLLSPRAPADEPRWRGTRRRRTIESSALARIDALARRHDTTPFVVALSACQIWLHRTFGRHDFIVGSPAHGRTASADAAIVGYFANLLPLRCHVDAADSLDALITRNTRTVRDALAHQDLPFPLMVERLAAARSTLDTPWIQAAFVWHEASEAATADLGAFILGAEKACLPLGDVRLEAIPLDRRAVEFDLTLTVARSGDDVAVTLDTRDAAFDSAEAARLLDTFADVLADATLSPDEAIGAAAPAVVHERFAREAARDPEAIAVRCGEETLTYAELEARANQLARYLRRYERRPEALIGIHLDRSLDLPVAMLAVLKANAAYLPIDVQAPPARVARMMDTGGARVLITMQAPGARIEMSGVHQIQLDAQHAEIARERTDPLDLASHPDQAAYCIYTSGSTGQPKGVVVTHRNVLGLLAATERHFGFGPRDVWTLFHSPAFDFSVWEIWGALLHGGQLVIVPSDIYRDPRAFADLLVRRRVTVLNQTPSAFRGLAPEVLASPEPPPLRVVIFGGEALDPATLRPWVSRFGVERPRLVNMYGITETTVHVTRHVVTAEDVFGQGGSVIGRAIEGWSVHVVDRQFGPVATGEEGEILVGGAGVTRGYVEQPALTAERFVPDPFSGVPGARLYRSGDLAARRRDDDLTYLGRADHQVKVRGYRIELGEIEAAIRRQPGVADVAVILDRDDLRSRPGQRDAATHDSGTRTPNAEADLVVRGARTYLKSGATYDDTRAGICACIVPAPGTDFSTDAGRTRLLDGLRVTLPDYMLPARVVTIARLPLNENGKLDRPALILAARGPLAVADAERSFRAPSDQVEAALAEIWAHVLGLPRVGVDDNYFLLGGDSIRALQVVALAEERGIRFDVAALFECQTIRALRARCRADDEPAAGRTRSVPFGLIEEQDRRNVPAAAVDAYPLARMQAGLIYHGTDHPGTSVYRASFLYEFEGPFDNVLLRAALRAVVQAHPVLRTSIDLATYREPLQIVQAAIVEPLSVVDLRGRATDAQEREIEAWFDAERARDFDLGVAPLFRAHALRLAEDRFALGLTCHDAILDGWSTATLLTEWLTRYDAALGGVEPSIDPPDVTYRDFVALERQTLRTGAHASFWRDELRDCTVSRLPGSSTTRGGPPLLRVLDVPIPRPVRDGLIALARRAGVSLKHVLLAAHLRVLAVSTGSSDVVTGLEANGRVESGDGTRVVGQHLNTVPFRLALTGGTWLDLVRATFEQERRLLPHRRFPYAEIQRQQGGRALYDTTFNYTHFHVFRALGAMSRVRAVAGRGRELTHYVLKTEFNRDAFTDDINLDVIFDAHLIDDASVAAIGQRYRAALDALAGDPTRHYDQDALLGPAERQRVARASTGLRVERADLTVTDLIEAQAARTPDLTAVSFRDNRLTFDALNSRAETLAATLRQMGVGIETRVGVFMERSLELAVALLAIWKAGGAYVPLDPDYPRERLAFMAADADVRLVLTQPHLADRAPVAGIAVLPVTAHALATRADAAMTPIKAAAIPPARMSARARHPEQAAYVIYTSGSTGRPKGALNAHRAVANRLLWMIDAYGFAPGERILQKTPISFDVSVWELFAPLVAGAELVMAEPGGHHDPDYLASVIAARAITTVHFVPSMLSLFLDAPAVRRCTSLRRVICSGEALTPSVNARFHATLGAALHNLYGPTEAAVDVTAWPCADTHADRIPIGYPIENTTMHLLDPHLQPVPPGTPGEAFIGGLAVGRGYWNAPALTAERFVPDPFSATPGARLYRTGDLARLSAEDAIEYLGRLDAQVKLHGVRIEPGEIESVLRAHPAVHECAVVVIDRAGAPALCAYVVERDGKGKPEEELRAWVSARVPRSMTPSVWIWLDALPLSPSGKLDRRALPPPRPDTPARTPESLLAEIEHLSDEDVEAWLARTATGTASGSGLETAR